MANTHSRLCLSVSPAGSRVLFIFVPWACLFVFSQRGVSEVCHDIRGEGVLLLRVCQPTSLQAKVWSIVSDFLEINWKFPLIRLGGHVGTFPFLYSSLTSPEVIADKGTLYLCAPTPVPSTTTLSLPLALHRASNPPASIFTSEVGGVRRIPTVTPHGQAAVEIAQRSAGLRRQKLRQVKAPSSAVPRATLLMIPRCRRRSEPLVFVLVVSCYLPSCFISFLLFYSGSSSHLLLGTL